jgi:hypothetical protein
VNTSENFNHKAVVTADEDFLQSLKDYMSQFSDGQEPETPLFTKADGSIDRERTLALPCYTDFKGTAPLGRSLSLKKK